jgi:hypothetical protein
MFEKLSGSRLSTGNTEHGQRQHGSFSLSTEDLLSCSIRVKPLFKHPLKGIFQRLALSLKTDIPQVRREFCAIKVGIVFPEVKRTH